MTTIVKPCKLSELDVNLLTLQFYTKKDGTFTEPRLQYNDQPFALEVGDNEERMWMGGFKVYDQATRQYMDLKSDDAKPWLERTADFSNYFTMKADFSARVDQRMAAKLCALREKIGDLFREHSKALLKGRAPETCTADVLDLVVRRKFIEADAAQSTDSSFIRIKCRMNVVRRDSPTQRAMVLAAKAGEYAGIEDEFVLRPSANFYEEAIADKIVVDPVATLCNYRTDGKVVMTFDFFNREDVWYVSANAQAAAVWLSSNDGARAANGGDRVPRFSFALSDHATPSVTTTSSSKASLQNAQDVGYDSDYERELPAPPTKKSKK